MNDDPESHSSSVIDVATLDPLWSESLPACAALAERAVRQALEVARIATPPANPAARSLTLVEEISIVLADDETVRSLNRDYRGKDRATNVLSFPADDSSAQLTGPEAGQGSGMPRLLGDVVLARETLEREAAAQNKTLDAHFMHLVIHGVLHLLGFDHEADREAEIMERLESQAMGRLGLTDPYADPGHPPRLAAATAEGAH